MAEETINEELTGMAAPADDIEMTEEPVDTGLTAESMKTNYDAMEPEKQQAIKSLLNEPVSQLFDELTGQTVMSEFAMQIAEAPAKEPMPEGEGMMAPTTEEEPAPLV